MNILAYHDSQTMYITIVITIMIINSVNKAYTKQHTYIHSKLHTTKTVADGPVGQVLAGPVSECNKYISIISMTMLT